MKIKTADLLGPALDWAVAMCVGKIHGYKYQLVDDCRHFIPYSPSTDWSQGGPIIERECLEVRVFAEHGAPDGGPYWISEHHPEVGHGPTVLIAAMRCLVASRLGDEVDVPDELV